MAGRLNKKFSRWLMVAWRDQPSRYDIEALQDNIRRVGLVVRVRWMLIAVLIAYSIIGGGLYASRMAIVKLAGLMWIPALALGIVLVYNAYYSLNYRRLGNIAVWNQLQLLLDVLVVTVLVYFSGGVNSWFWSMYSLFILEAAFILPRSGDTWMLALACMVVLGGIEGLEFFGLIAHANIPFAGAHLHRDLVFVAIRYMWQVAVLAGTAGVAVLLVGEFRHELSTRNSQKILDPATGLYSRNYLLRALPIELRRAERDARTLHVMLLDIDNFGEFNTRFGLDAGDRLLKELAEKWQGTLRGRTGEDSATTNVVARIGGEEFAVLLAEDESHESLILREEALVLANVIRTETMDLRVDGAGVTVSVGMATYPSDGGTVEQLMDAADAALAVAIERGGNRVVSADELSDDVATDSVLDEL